MGNNTRTATANVMSGGERFPATVSGLMSSLRALKEKNPKACRSVTHVYPSAVYCHPGETGGDLLITSWKMTEHMYYNKDNGFPTYARGLFTELVGGADQVPAAALPSYGDGEIQDRIVARGYDKFFNTNEMAWTTWDAIGRHSQPPYHLTLKSNGCLILISALSPSHLLVASKHSLGTTTVTDVASLTLDLSSIALDSPASDSQDSLAAQKTDQAEEAEAKSHAAVGREWVAKTLKAKGKTSAELARRLWDENVTAVLELCDDDFEEHVIATPEKWTGLHLHGLNYNTPLFATKSPDEVTAFAKEFGFIVTKHFMLNSAKEVKEFADKVAETGTWEGDMIEGFVVRSVVADTTGHDESRPPYRPGAPFFFKIKFEEPYLLYRQWRETTRTLLGVLKPGTSAAKEDEIWKRVRSKLRRPEVGVYAEWCIDMIKKEPGLFNNYERGVVRVRERFLQWIEGEGKSIWKDAKEGRWKPRATLQSEKSKAEKDAELVNLPKKWVLVPIAVPGCGKTTIGVALTQLFGFSHTQSDDVSSKRTAPTFLRNIVNLLKTSDVVYADRNNHIDKHYLEITSLRDDKQHLKSLKPYNVRYIGIVWDVDSKPYHRMLRLCSERVVSRGDNHQTLRPDPSFQAEHEAVVASFLQRFNLPDPTIFDDLVRVDPEDPLGVSLEKIVEQLCPMLGLARPSADAMKRALQKALAYKTTTAYHPPVRVGKDIRYFGIAPEINLEVILDECLDLNRALEARAANASVASAEARAFVACLREKGRVTVKPHITLSHNANVAEEKAAAPEGAPPGPQEQTWNTCKALAESPLSPLYDFDLTHLVWDRRVMTFVVDHLRPSENEGAEIGRPVAAPLPLPQEVEENLHITVGTAAEEISAFEARNLVRMAREGDRNGYSSGEVGESVEGGGPVHWTPVVAIRGAGRVRGMF